MAIRSLVRALASAVAFLLATSLPLHEARAQSAAEVATALKTAYSLYDQFLANRLTLEQATQQIVDAIGRAEAQIVAHIDRIHAADGRACSRATVVLFADIERMSPDNQMALANQAVSCLSLIESYLAAFQDPAAVDELGFALNALGPVTLMARARVGYPPSRAVSDMLVHGNASVIAKLEPSCVTHTLHGDSTGGYIEQNITCRAYNGELGYAYSYVGDPSQPQLREDAKDDATRNTSRTIARRVEDDIP